MATSTAAADATAAAATAPQPRPFRFAPAPADVAAVHAKLRAARLPPASTQPPWRDGVALDAVRALADRWLDGFDWHKHAEPLLFPADAGDADGPRPEHFLLEVDGLDLHFVLLAARETPADEADGVPLMIVHGWPGCFLEGLTLLPHLARLPGAAARDIIIPSLPGFGFSAAPTTPGFGVASIARSLHRLMLALGYNKYAIQGGDWGAIVCQAIATGFPDACRAVHLTMPVVGPPLGLAYPVSSAKLIAGGLLGFDWVYSRQEAAGIAKMQKLLKNSNGYRAIQETKPQNLAYALSDSPVGLMAWLLEFYHIATDRDSDGEDPATGLPRSIPADLFLSIVSVYYFTNSIASSMRLYYEYRDLKEAKVTANGRINQPVGVLTFPHEVLPFPESWVRIRMNVKTFNYAKKGGHFNAIESPVELAQDIAAFLSLDSVRAALAKQ